ncbi:MAG: polar amino acid transport system substrate-binding protein [Glaciecola sp.]|jgi:polar amino acid transport system substrate-binding protein
MFDNMILFISCVSKYWSILMGCCLNLLIGVAQAENYLEQDRAMRFAVIYTEEPPYTYSNQISEYNGIVPKVVEALARELSFEVEFFPTSRKGLEASIIKGQADFSWLAPEWSQNTDTLIFSDPVLNHREFLYSLKPFYLSDKPVDWVRDKTICVHEDYTYPLLTPFFDEQIAEAIQVSSQVAITTLFLGQKCDLLYINELRANWIFKALSSGIEIHRSPQPLKQTQQAFMFSKSWQNLMPKINQGIANIIHSGELKEIVRVQTHLNLYTSE